jgi:PQQ-dependent catabolism-associated CXXCW motif protein
MVRDIQFLMDRTRVTEYRLGSIMKFFGMYRIRTNGVTSRVVRTAASWTGLNRLFLGLMLVLASMPGYLQAAELPIPKRFALVIGNDKYQHVGKLEKAANDAQAMGKALEAAQFSTRVLLNANRSQMSRAINQFVAELEDGGVGVFFFAGHGVQINNQNFLIPVDLQEYQVEGDIADQSISLQSVQDKLVDARAKFTLLVVDACRDNPLPRRAGRALGATRGLSQASSAEGQIVVFSAGANQQALDKVTDQDENPNGLFTREFLPWIAKPGVTIRDAVLGVRSAVRASARSVNHEQFPAVYDQAEGQFYFYPPSQSGQTSPAPAGPDPSQALRAELAMWEQVKTSRLAEEVAAFLERYPQGQFADIAAARIEGLKAAAAEKAAAELAMAERLAREKLVATPRAPSFAFEDKDWGVAPWKVPRKDKYHAPTPLTIPGAKVIRTLELKSMLDVDKLAVVIDVLEGKDRKTVAGAFWMPGLGDGQFYGAEKGRMAAALAKITGGNKDRPLVFMCVNSECWLSYNATLHAVEAGYTQVYWFRGGSTSWNAASLPLESANKASW